MYLGARAPCPNVEPPLNLTNHKTFALISRLCLYCACVKSTETRQSFVKRRKYADFLPSYCRVCSSSSNSKDAARLPLPALIGLMIMMIEIFVINRFFMKLFKTNNIETVKACQEFFGFQLPSVQLSRRTEKFEIQFHEISRPAKS